MKKIATTFLALMMALSVTALASTTATDPKSNAVTAPAAELTCSINGQALALGEMKLYKEKEIVMVPLRLVAEALGFTVTWSSDEQAAGIDDGTVKTKVYIGKDSYYKSSSKAIGLTRAIELGAETVLSNGQTTYVPAALFALLYGNEGAVTITSENVDITNK